MLDRLVDAFSAVLYAMALVDSTRQNPREFQAQVAARARWHVRVRQLGH